MQQSLPFRVLTKIRNMRIYFIQWNDCIGNVQFLVVNASSRKERDVKFEKWCGENPEIAPAAYSARSVMVEDCILLNKTT